MPENAKIEVILQFLHDHSRLVCNELNKKADSQVWKTTPLTDSMRRNLIFHYGSSGLKYIKKDIILTNLLSIVARVNKKRQPFRNLLQNPLFLSILKWLNSMTKSLNLLPKFRSQKAD